MILFKDLKNDLKGTLPELAIYDNQLVVSCHLIVKVYDLTSGFELTDYNNSDAEISMNPLIIENEVVFTYKNDFYTLKDKMPILHNKLPKSLIAFNNEDGMKEVVSYLGNNQSIILYQNSNTSEIFIDFLDQGTWKKISSPQELDGYRITHITKLDGDIWFCTSGGIFIMQLQDNELVYKRRMLSYSFTTDVIKDRDNNYWVTTVSDGIFVFPNIYIESIALPDQTGDPRALAIDHKENLFIGTSIGKAFQYNSITKTVENLKIEGNRAVSEIIYDPYRDQKTFYKIS
ncbi:hypothetical protein JCM19297_1369 [Nonlabens ulvanivorans]|nr:hypothetical protein [Nonlabens ulvanivorans]GAK89541.1 hypothetical protein JCM19297_1369 [Nonlabens ulvanivorans]